MDNKEKSLPNRAQEQQALRELNSRLRNVLQVEQEGNSDLKKRLVDFQTNVAATFNHNQRLEEKLEKTWGIIALNGTNGEEVAPPKELAMEGLYLHYWALTKTYKNSPQPTKEFCLL